MDADDPLDRREVRQAAGHRRGATSGRSRPATPSARRPRSFHTHYRVAAGPPRARARYRNITGNEATALGFAGRVEARRPAAVLRLVPDHARRRTSSTSCRATRTSGSRRSRPRTRSPRSARRSARRYGGALGLTGVVRARASPSRREAMGLAVMVELPLVVIDVQRAGPSTGHADQERAGGPAPGDVRPQRRLADAGRRPGDARRVLRPRDRGLAASRSST